MKDRIRKIMESQHMTQQTFAQFIGMSPASLSSIFNGRTRPTINIIEAIKNKIPNISTDWMMFGREPMYIDKQPAQNTSSNISDPVSTDTHIDFDSKISTPSPSLFDDDNMRNVNTTPKNIENTVVKYIDKPQRQITEIRVFYDDQTWETFVPKK
jgi:DNA-binding XRE family transcriptional regulator